MQPSEIQYMFQVSCMRYLTDLLDGITELFECQLAYRLARNDLQITGYVFKMMASLVSH